MRRFGPLLILLAVLTTSCSSGDSVFSMSVGDCFSTPETVEISRVETLSCSEPHDHEVYLLFDIADGDFPGTDAVTSEAGDGCLAGFDQYVGAVYSESSLAVGFLPPTENTWDSGDREVVCYVSDFTGAKLTETVRDSGL